MAEFHVPRRFNWSTMSSEVDYDALKSQVYETTQYVHPNDGGAPVKVTYHTSLGESNRDAARAASEATGRPISDFWSHSDGDGKSGCHTSSGPWRS